MSDESGARAPKTCSVEVSDLEKVFRLYHGRARMLKTAVLSFWRRQRCEELHALRGVSFGVPAGETVAVIGRNGSGKSTLLRILGRVFTPTRGRVVVRGRVSTLLDLGAGFHPDLTGTENIYLNGAILGLRTHAIGERIGDIVRFAELERFIDSPLKTYSDGMVMRLGFAVAVEADPDVLLVDEVLAVGDEAFQEKCYRRIGEFQRGGKTIIFVSHDLAAVRRAAGRAIWLKDGAIEADGKTGEVVDQYMKFIESEEARAGNGR